MKKIILTVAVFGLSLCQAVEFRISKIIKPLNVYILENKYVVQTREEIPGYKKGNKINLDIEFFFNHEAFSQDVLIRREKLVTKKDSSTVIVTDYDVEYIDNYVTTVEDDSYFKRVTFTCLGVLQSGPTNIQGFINFASTRAVIQPIRDYMYLYEDVNWFHTDKDLDYQQNFPEAGSGEELSLAWLIEGYNLIDPKYKEEIYLIFNKNYPEYLSAVLYSGKKRKVFLHDRITSLAKFQ